MPRWNAILPILLLSAGSALAAPTVLQPVTDDAAMAAMQAQRPAWAPGTTPRLVHEATDRDRRTSLRVVTWTAGVPTVQWVPGSKNSRTESLSGGVARADTAPIWWDDRSFFFIRALGAGGRLMVWDGAPRDVGATLPPVLEVVAESATGHLLASLEDPSGAEVFDLGAPASLLPRPLRLSNNSGGVEHSLSPAGPLVYTISTRREGARLLSFRPGQKDSAFEPKGQAVLQGHELLALTPVPGTDSVLALSRLHPPLIPDGGPVIHCIVELGALTTGPLTIRQIVRNVFVPAGLAPRPALSKDGRWVYAVGDDPQLRNPVLRIERTTGKTERLDLALRGAQEVAVAEYPGPGGRPQTWLAVVAVGDLVGDDVRNHLYVGPIP